MKTFTNLTAAAVLIIIFFLACQPQPDLKNIKSQVNEINDMMVQSIMKNDPDAVLKYYAEDAISLPSYQPMIKGIEALKKQSENQPEMKMNSFNLNTTDVLVSGKFVVEIGTYDLAMEMPEMGEVKDKGKYLTLFEIQNNGSLLIKADTWNTDMNPWQDMMNHKEENK